MATRLWLFLGWLKRGGSVELRQLGARPDLLRQGTIFFAPSKSLTKSDKRRWSSDKGDWLMALSWLAEARWQR